MVQSFKELGARMSIKIHFLNSHLNYFPDNCGDYSEDQGERFHQGVATMEARYQGHVTINILADYCWSLKRDSKDQIYKRKSLKQAFV